MTSDTEMGDDTVPAAPVSARLYNKPRLGNLWPGPNRSISAAARTTSKVSASSPRSAASTSRRSSLANLVHGLDVSDNHDQHDEIVDHVEGEGEDGLEGGLEGDLEGDDEEEDDDEGEEGEGEGEGEGGEVEGEEDEEDDDEEEDDEDDESESDTEDDPARERSTESKPNSLAAPTPVDPPPQSNGQIPVVACQDPASQATPIAVTMSTPPPVSAASTLTEPPTSHPAPPVEAAPAANEEASASTATIKPKSKAAKPRKHRTPSPSPPPAMAPPPMRTIRLNITLGGPSNYEVDIARQAKDTGQRDATPPPLLVVKAESEEEDKDKGEAEQPEGTAKKKRKKKGTAQEYYDTSDPFIDDSELAVDQRTYFAQTKQQGFYVSSGEVALLKDKTSKKPKSKKALLGPMGSQGGPSSTVGGVRREGSGDGSRDSPIALVDMDDASGAGDVHHGISKGIKGVGLVSSSGVIGGNKTDMKESSKDAKMDIEEEGDEKTGQKRKRYITVVEGGKKRKIVNISSFNPELQAAIETLKQAIARENWEQKGKFPPSLKPLVAQLALLAIKLDEYDDHFFNLMPVLFPYNKFTMTKLIKRTVYPDHIALLQERQDQLLKQLGDLATAGFAKAEEEWEKNVAAWDKRQEKLRLEALNNPNGSTVPGALNPEGGGGGGSAGGSAAPTRHPTEEKDVVDGADGGAGAEGKAAAANAAGHGTHPPGKRYRLTDQMKSIIWDLVLLSNESCRLENEKNGFEGSVIQISEQGLRKVLYQKIVAAFPDGWMSSGQISRDVSAMKKRLERETMDHDL